jgi:DNA-directed RNA polymerase subunit M/transcription elongation factor TFIIS
MGRDVNGRRTRFVSSRRLWLLRPLLRYSFTVNAYVFRLGGRRWGPMLRPKDNIGLQVAPRRDELTLSEEFNDEPLPSDPRYPVYDLVDRQSRSNRDNGVPITNRNAETAKSAPTDARPALSIVRDHVSSHYSFEEGRKLMRPFNRSNQCPKCGSAKASVVYHDPGTEDKGCDPGEHIHRECLICGYPWSDACLELAENHPVAGMPTAEPLEMNL